MLRIRTWKAEGSMFSKSGRFQVDTDTPGCLIKILDSSETQESPTIELLELLEPRGNHTHSSESEPRM